MQWSPRRRLRATRAGSRSREAGQTNVEYALIVAGVAVILIAAVWTFGGSTDDRFTTTATNVPGATLKPPSGVVECDTNYTGACIPPAPPKLSCADLQARDLVPVTVVGSDPHGLDPDHNGIGCG